MQVRVVVIVMVVVLVLVQASDPKQVRALQARWPGKPIRARRRQSVRTMPMGLDEMECSRFKSLQDT